MYICLTNRCHGRCDNCLEKQWFSANGSRPVQDMSLSKFEKILAMSDGMNWREQPVLELCGGEVLLYPQLESVLALVQQKNIAVDIQTSLMGDPAYLAYLVGKYGNSIREWQINADYSYENSELFVANLWKIVNKGIFTLHCTLQPKISSVSKECDRITRILESFASDTKPKISICTAVPFAGGGKELYDFTEDIRTLVSHVTAKYPSALFYIRQPFCYCEINEEKLADIANLEILEDSFFCNNYEGMILPDGSYRWCPALPEVVAYNINECKNFHQLFDKRKEYSETLKKRLFFPQKCRECEHFNPGKCFAPCFAKFPF